MDPRYLVTREELYNVQMDLKHVQATQSNHAERLFRLERRQQEDAAVKSVWSSPFPTALSGTPQHGPIHLPPQGPFDLDDQNHTIASLHLEPDDEPARRGAASRANSVRFDESANWGQSTRHSGEFGPIRPGSGLAMERSSSHKSDGRHSSTGHSVHSAHSMTSGRGSSLALDTHLMFGGHEDDSPLDMPGPSPALHILGSYPAIIRCWLTSDFTSSAILYAAVCSGAMASTLDYSLVTELGLAGEIYRGMDGVQRIRLPVYLTEAREYHSSARSPNPDPHIPSIAATFEIVGGGEQLSGVDADKRAIRIFIGSDTLRATNADLFLSRNQMDIYGNDRDKLSVPFVRPEDDSVFKNLRTSNIVLEKPKLNAEAAEFISGEPKPGSEQAEPDEAEEHAAAPRAPGEDEAESQGLVSPTMANEPAQSSRWVSASNPSESGGESERPPRHSTSSDQSGRDAAAAAAAAAAGAEGGGSSGRRDASAIWGSWRSNNSGSGDASQRDGFLSGYQPPSRPRTMKVLKSKSGGGSSSSARTGASYEPPPPPRSTGGGEQQRRKSQGAASASGENSSTSGTGSGTGSTTNSVRWDSKRSLNGGGGGGGGPAAKESKPPSAPTSGSNPGPPLPRSANPVGGASAFAWMNPGKPKAHAAAAD